MGFINLDLEAVESYVANHLRLFISMAIGLVVFVGIIAVTVFFIHIRGAEQTMVPNVQGQELTAALLELQVKELYPRIQLRYTQSSADRGLILEQSPPPGTIVRAGRRVSLVVSQGVMINVVENFIGRNLEEVQMELSAVYSAQGTQLITVRQPIMFEFSNESPGTILQQRPEPGTGISGPMMIDLVVSRGAEHVTTRLPNLIGLNLSDTLEYIGRTGIDFEFTLRPAAQGEEAGTVVAQNPPPDELVPSNTRVSITLAEPTGLGPNELFGLFVYDMARNPYPLLVRLESIQPGGERQRLLTVQYGGGRLTVPYLEPAGSVLVLSLLNREIHRETVGGM